MIPKLLVLAPVHPNKSPTTKYILLGGISSIQRLTDGQSKIRAYLQDQFVQIRERNQVGAYSFI